MAKQRSTTGTRLHEIFKTYLRQDFTPTCTCRSTVEAMDSNPISWTEQNIEMIVGKIRAEIKNRKWWGKLVAAIPGVGRPVRWLVQEAIRRARADEEKAESGLDSGQ